MSQGDFARLLWKHLMGPVYQKHRCFWGEFPLNYLLAVTAGVRHIRMTVTSFHSQETIAKLSVFLFLCPSHGNNHNWGSSIRIETHLAPERFWPKSHHYHYSPCLFLLLPLAIKQDFPECSLLAGQKAFRGKGGDVESRHDESDVEEAFKWYCSAFQRETGSFMYLYFVQTFRS